MKLIGEKPLTPDERRKRYEDKYGAEYIKQKSNERYLRNKEKVLKRSREWAAANPEKVLEKAAKYREKYPERMKESQDKYNAKPESSLRFVRYRASDKAKAYKKSWRAANTERVRVQALMDGARRRARKANNGVFKITAKDMRRLLSQGCAECFSQGEHIDHIVPISRGGRHSIGNLQMLCSFCNLSKNNKLTMEWRARKRLAAA